MTGGRSGAGDRRRDAGPPRWQDPELDEAALAVARLAREVAGSLRSTGRDRWPLYLDPLVPPLEDGDRVDVQAAARRVRAAFGARDSLLDAEAGPRALDLRDAVDRLLLLLERRRASGT